MADAMLRALFSNLIGGGGAVASHVYDTEPNHDDIALADASDSFATPTEIASTVGSVDVWAYGMFIAQISVDCDGKIECSTGAAAAETEWATFPIQRLDIGTAANTGNTGGDGTVWTVPYPVRMPNGTRISGAFGSSSGSATCTVVQCYIKTLAG